MIAIKNKQAVLKMETAGIRISSILNEIVEIIQPGVSTLELDAWIERQLKQHELTSMTKGYMNYKHVSCISVNDEVVHGVPRSDKILRNGDLVKIDVCASWKGYAADMARCYFVGTVSDEVKKLVEVAQRALDCGIAKACVGNRVGDISAAIQDEVERHGFGVVRDFAGHGIGKSMHEDPEILNYGKPGRGPVLQSGMTFAIEPMITMGDHAVAIGRDGWTVTTQDKSIAAHVEDTVLITEQGPQVLTRRNVGS